MRMTLFTPLAMVRLLGSRYTATRGAAAFGATLTSPGFKHHSAEATGRKMGAAPSKTNRRQAGNGPMLLRMNACLPGYALGPALPRHFQELCNPGEYAPLGRGQLKLKGGL